MSQENVRLLLEGYDSWNRQDAGWLSERLTDDFELLPAAGSFLGLEPLYRGKEGWEQFLRDWRTAWEAHRFRVERSESLGDRTLVLVVSEGKGRESGATVELQTGHLWTHRDGLISRGVIYLSWTEALEVVGLSE
jgi:ketosteroid isomerase-like protein